MLGQVHGVAVNQPEGAAEREDFSELEGGLADDRELAVHRGMHGQLAAPVGSTVRWAEQHPLADRVALAFNRVHTTQGQRHQASRCS